MKVRSLVLAAFAALCASSAHGININQSAFTANGGNLQNIAGTAPNVFDKLRTASLAPQFGPVGNLGACTGTWLGTEGQHAWVLTAAHCVGSQRTATPLDQLRFRDGQGRLLAGGPGTLMVVHPNRLNPPNGMSNNATDIVMLKMPLLAEPGTPLPVGATIHDGAAKVDGTVALVGHGVVGVGQAQVSAWPTTGQRRAWGEMRLSRTQDNGYVGVSNYIPGNSATSWTRASVGDDGAAWWQKHEGEWSVVATTNGGHAGSTTGVLVQKYASWINEVFPGARLTSERLRVTASQAFVSHDFAADAGDGDLAFLVAPNQAELGETMLDVPVRDKWGNAKTAKLRAHRVVDSNTSAVQTILKIWYNPADNHHLWNHRWQGKVAIDVQKWNVAVDHRFELDVDIDKTQFKGRVTRTAAYHSGNVLQQLAMQQPDRYRRSDVLPFTVDPQPGASGPTTPAGHLGWGGHSTIVVDARSAVTQTIVPIKLRAQRYIGCNRSWRPMNNNFGCLFEFWNQGDGRLVVWFDPADNPGLSADRYLGEVVIRYHNSFISGLFRLEVDIDNIH